MLKKGEIARKADPSPHRFCASEIEERLSGKSGAPECYIIIAQIPDNKFWQELLSVDVSPLPADWLATNDEFFRVKITLDILPPGD